MQQKGAEEEFGSETSEEFKEFGFETLDTINTVHEVLEEILLQELYKFDPADLKKLYGVGNFATMYGAGCTLSELILFVNDTLYQDLPKLNANTATDPFAAYGPYSRYIEGVHTIYDLQKKIKIREENNLPPIDLLQLIDKISKQEIALHPEEAETLKTQVMKLKQKKSQDPNQQQPDGHYDQIIDRIEKMTPLGRKIFKINEALNRIDEQQNKIEYYKRLEEAELQDIKKEELRIAERKLQCANKLKELDQKIDQSNQKREKLLKKRKELNQQFPNQSNQKDNLSQQALKTNQQEVQFTEEESKSQKQKVTMEPPSSMHTPYQQNPYQIVLEQQKKEQPLIKALSNNTQITESVTQQTQNISQQQKLQNQKKKKKDCILI